MARKLMASKAYLRKNDDNRISMGKAISSSLKANMAKFKNLPYTDTDLQAKNDELSDASVAAKTGDRKASADLKVVREEWKTMFGETTDAVSLEANGVEGLILDAGMTPTSSANKKKQQPEQPKNTVAKPGIKKGSCSLSVDPQADVNGYIGILTSPDAKLEMVGDTLKITLGSSIVYLQAGTRRDLLMDGLPSATSFCGTIFTFNSAGSSPLANSEEMVTQ